MKFSPKNSTLFISHDAPDILTEKTAAHDFFKNLAKNFTKPKAIIVFSAYYESDVLEITGNLHLKTIHDFGGFAPELYQTTYDAKGSPDLAEEIWQLFSSLDINAKIDPKRGLDHGAWIPLKLIYPNADIPVIQISIQSNEDALYSYKIGKIISYFKEQNILIIGSGSITHNLAMAFRNKDKPTPNWVEDFSEIIFKKLQNNDLRALINWHELPFAQENHPSFEHFIPLLITLGATSENFKSQRLHHSFDYSVLTMDCYVFTDEPAKN